MFGRGISKDDLDQLADQLKVIRHELHEMHGWKAELDHIRKLCDQMYQILRKLGE